MEGDEHEKDDDAEGANTGEERAVDGAAGTGRRGKRRRWGKMWVRYCLVWGTVSTVLYGAWLPPA
jgi:hypothetical protein